MILDLCFQAIFTTLSFLSSFFFWENVEAKCSRFFEIFKIFDFQTFLFSSSVMEAHAARRTFYFDVCCTSITLKTFSKMFGHAEQKILRVRLLSMAFFWIYWYLSFFLWTVFEKSGYLKNWFRYFTGFPNCLNKKSRSNIFDKKNCIWIFFSRISLDSQDLPIWTFWRSKYIENALCWKKLGERNISQKCTILKKAWRAKYIAKCTILKKTWRAKYIEKYTMLKIRKYYIDYQISSLPISQKWVLETKECSK